MQSLKNKKAFYVGGVIAPLLIIALLISFIPPSEGVIVALAQVQDGPARSYGYIVNLTVSYKDLAGNPGYVDYTAAGQTQSIPKGSIIAIITVRVFISNQIVSTATDAMARTRVFINVTRPDGSIAISNALANPISATPTFFGDGFIVLHTIGSSDNPSGPTLNVDGTWQISIRYEIYM